MHYIVPVHYPQHACTRCDGRGWLLTPVSREDYPCSHIAYKRVNVAPEVLVREAREREAQEREIQARYQALMSELLGEAP